MKYVITGGAGNISKPVALQLIKGGHEVTVIGRNAANLKELTDTGARAAIGSVEDLAFLTSVFQHADAVYTMVPPMYPTSDWKGHIAGIGQLYADAIKATGVKFVVNLSSIGAHLPDGVGPVSGLHRVENALNALEGVNVKHLRPAYFYNNLLANIGMVKGMGVIGANFSLAEGKFPIVSPADIAEAAAEELAKLDFTGSTVRYIVSDEVSTNQIAAELGKAIGKPDLAWVQFTDEQALGGMVQAGLPEEVAKNYAEMNQSLHTGAMAADYFKTRTGTLGKIKLAAFAKTFAAAYNA
ncbi:MAG: NmrA family NAD(P)-binding protein [Bacteroidota bacterium]